MLFHILCYGETKINAHVPCAQCHELKLTEKLSGQGEVSKMVQARFLFLHMQKRFSSVRFNPTCNAEKAGDDAESTGGILSPWRVSAGVVLEHLTKMFSLSQDDVGETGEAIGAFARQVKILYAHICRSEPIVAARVPKIYDTILRQIVPAIERPCRESVCPVCESS